VPSLVETMFSVRKQPWHGLGTVVNQAPHSEAALYLAGLDWAVKQRRVEVSGLAVEGYWANVRSDTGAVLGIVGKRYRPVQNSEAFMWTDALIGSGEVRYETAGALQGGRTVWLLARLNEERKVLGDEVAPYLLFTNSHDGRAAIRVVITPVRVVCWNTLNIALSRARRRLDRSWSVAHLVGLFDRLDGAREALGLARRYLADLDETAKLLADKIIGEDRWQEIVNQLIPLPEGAKERQRQNVDALRKDLAARIRAPDLAEFEGTGWAAVNAVADYVAHRPLWDESKKIFVPLTSTPVTEETRRPLESRFSEVAHGHPLVDKAVDLILAW
jgi:phage/plasmid-like protein (TIGR03299 family)